jgi:hypothetical protein
MYVQKSMSTPDGQIFNVSGAAFPAMKAEQLDAHQLLPSALITIRHQPTISL